MTTTHTPAPAQPVTTSAERYPLTCQWCRNSPADHMAVYDYRSERSSGRETSMVCGPCGHSVTILPASFETWWLFRLAPDAAAGTSECCNHGALVIAALDEAAADRDHRAEVHCFDCTWTGEGPCPDQREHTQRAGEYRQARDELLEASHG